jgi:hypothetical protein
MKEHTEDRLQFYSYKPDTFEFAGTGWCDFSPARDYKGDLLEPNVQHLPGSATLTPVPDLRPKQAALYLPDSDEWAVVEDHRGEVRWGDGQFHTVTGLGPVDLPELVVHDAQYLIGEDPNVSRIRMWLNDDVIEFDDVPDILERQVLAAWEAKGETIRPADPPEGDWQKPEPLQEPTSPEEHQRKLDEQIARMLSVAGYRKGEEPDHA